MAFQWVPGHTSIEDNVDADGATKDAAPSNKIG